MNNLNEEKRHRAYRYLDAISNPGNETEQELIHKCLDPTDEDQLLYITTYVARQIQEKYGFRWAKCFSLVTQSSWWNCHLDTEQIEEPNLDEITASVIRQVDNDEIF